MGEKSSASERAKALYDARMRKMAAASRIEAASAIEATLIRHGHNDAAAIVRQYQIATKSAHGL